MKSYKEKFKNLKDSELIDIVENKSQFEKAAIEAAERELSERGIEASKSNSSASDNAPNKFISKITGVAHDIQPSIVRKGKYEKIILMLSIFFILPYLFYLYKNLVFISNSIIEKGVDIDIILVLLSFFAIPTSIFLFWKRRKVGWFLIVGYSLLMLIGNFFILVSIWNLDNFFIVNDNNTFFNLIASPEPMWEFVLYFLIYSLIVRFLLKSEIKELYGIN